MKTVQILMSTYNGEKYLDEQLQSLIDQEDVIVKILVRDDGSSDKTLEILRKWEIMGCIQYYQGENLGPSLSFMDLIQNAPNADYYAFCDQDDVWHKDKLAIAVKKLSMTKSNKPSLYFSSAKLVDKDLNFIGYSNLNPVYNLPGILLGSNAIGCTMVFNKELLDIIKFNIPKKSILHDAWTIRACLVIDGEVIFDGTPHIDYRQHENNVVGAINSPIRRYLRVIRNASKKRNQKSEIAKEVLEVFSDMMTTENVELVSLAANYKQSMRSRIRLAMDKRFRRNNYVDNFLFIIAVIQGYY